MSLHYSGYYEAVEQTKLHTDEQLLEQIDMLYGRDNLPCDYTHEQLLAETMLQLDREWTDTSSPEYEQRQFRLKLVTLGEH